MTMLAPKLKAEYMSDLKAHSLDRLKEIWQALKPKKATPFLPVEWKKADLETLREYYVNILVPDYDRPNDLHCKGWRRAQFVLELEMWINQREEQRKNDPLSDLPEDNHLCDACGIPLMVRTNRLTKEEFYGCLRFPSCKFTLPMSYGGRPTGMVQKEFAETLKTKGAKDVLDPRAKTKTGVVPKMKSKRGQVRQGGYASASDGSWMPVEQYVDADSEDDKKRTSMST